MNIGLGCLEHAHASVGMPPNMGRPFFNRLLWEGQGENREGKDGRETAEETGTAGHGGWPIGGDAEG